MRTRAKISGSRYKNLPISDITDIGYIGADTDTDINIGAPLYTIDYNANKLRK